METTIAKMNEDETFRKLRQTPLKEIPRIRAKWLANTHDDRLIEEILEEHGWTRDDWAKWRFHDGR